MSPSGNLAKRWVDQLRKIKIMFLSYIYLEEYYESKWKSCKTLGQLLEKIGQVVRKIFPLQLVKRENGDLGNSLVGYRYINIIV